jgi:hypothetical protein
MEVLVVVVVRIAQQLLVVLVTLQILLHRKEVMVEQGL